MTELKIPNLGENINEAKIIAVHLKKGQTVKQGDILLELETDKATLEIPATVEGTVDKILIAVGDSAKENQTIATLKTGASQAPKTADTPKRQETVKPKAEKATIQPVILKDLGEGIKEAIIIKISAAIGQTIKKGDILLELETDKATLEIPSDYEGQVVEVLVKDGDSIATGTKILTISGSVIAEQKPQTTTETATPKTKTTESKPEMIADNTKSQIDYSRRLKNNDAVLVPAAPIVRRFAREIGINITEVKGSLARGRISIDDVKLYSKNKNATAKGVSGAGVSASKQLPDFSSLGEVIRQEQNKIKQVTATNMLHSWQTVPQVTHFQEIDITELEKLRQKHKGLVEKKGAKLTITIIILKAIALALKKYPTFNSSYDEPNQQLIIKKYYNIGVAVDTPNGLLVPVVKDVDKKSLVDLAVEITDLSQKARVKKLMPEHLQGQNFTLSSLGGLEDIKNFIPMINWPDVAILGVSRINTQPEFIDSQFVPRLKLPLSLSYDHRVIDGAEAARFLGYLSAILTEPFFPFADL